jgi:hypothetical protein
MTSWEFTHTICPWHIISQMYFPLKVVDSRSPILGKLVNITPRTIEITWCNYSFWGLSTNL